jgi:spermidine synthase
MNRAPATPSLLAALVFVSGAAALVYQSLWMRSFGLVFGNTTDAVALVLAIFMGGLALGSGLVARREVAHPLRAYALVELGIAGGALATLPLLRALPSLYASVGPLRDLTGAADVLARGVAAALVLLPATLLLGATVPLAVEFLARGGRDAQEGLGRLYLVNTLGGALGVLLGPFVLLPALGVRGSFAAAALVNLLIGALAWRWSQDHAASVPSRSGASAEEVVPGESGTLPPFAVLAVLSGAFTFGIEVIWTRSLALVLGSSVYAFASMLLAVLLGLAAGTRAYEVLRPRLRHPARSLALLFLACGGLTLVGAVVIGRLPAAFLSLMKVLPASFSAYTAAGVLLALVALLPVTAILGVTFPLLLHLATAGGALRRTGRLYAWNTAGALAGALLADLVLLPRWGLQGSYLVLSGLILGAGTAAAVAARRGRAFLLAGSALAVMIGALFLAPRFRPWDPVLMTAGVYQYGPEWKDRPGFDLGKLREERRLLFYEEGREAVVAVSEPVGSGRLFLSVNGKTDAGSGVEDVLTQKFIAHVPLLLHAAPRRALIVGWGAGATAASAASHPLVRIECVEIEPATWRAAPHFAALSGRVRTDPRLHMIFRDGRTHLLRSREVYDVIISEPSNPWITGVANLFTREFYEIALQRLAPDGLFGQWFHYYRLSPGELKVELETFASVFPHVSLWLVPPITGKDGAGLAADLLLVGGRGPQGIDWPRLVSAFRGPAGDDLRATEVLRDEATLLAAFAMDEEAVRRFTAAPGSARKRPLNTDDYPAIELQTPRRNVMPPAEVALLAQGLHRALVAAASEPRVEGLEPGREADFWRTLAGRYTDSAQPTRALSALERALSLEPSLAAAQEELGNLALDLRDFLRAEKAYRALLRLEPRKVDAWLRLAAVLARQSKWADARAALHEARRLDPRAPVDPELVAFVEKQAAARE